ncbi:hypothetical protein [Vibrio splendidus]|uniref:hypothetical protein n=1 Tax=Vibrio splendidus TaxID=29497 RepID=UPI000D3611A7|nr:hypothetical protein [Vibrio splendidus]PTP92515.1 hypothetical protein CWO03_02520 [Vibrio splendidus]
MSSKTRKHTQKEQLNNVEKWSRKTQVFLAGFVAFVVVSLPFIKGLTGFGLEMPRTIGVSAGILVTVGGLMTQLKELGTIGYQIGVFYALIGGFAVVALIIYP